MADEDAGGTSGGSRDDAYYRELLARVDNAIVETRDNASGSCDPESLCKGCMARTISGALIAAAVVTECLISVKLLFTSDNSGPHVPSSSSSSSELNAI
ncbi:Hypothetical Protein FCC1311_025392 [Hondaea fermentalgiana]|uniref:Uncharacterized protein n=1 Tax=Hondaea fermentalgiana TaxID=2315210 RepID=A0A2R5G963_9STRA|nr:Hypothetical Protein FCC1311_025392 [Hondaea fermentalgiana]|eukprot:GBG26318.1 Hypothetical Protein FCC1311_025392 [Hondaea fermentalgiana]